MNQQEQVSQNYQEKLSPSAQAAAFVLEHMRNEKKRAEQFAELKAITKTRLNNYFDSDLWRLWETAKHKNPDEAQKYVLPILKDLKAIEDVIGSNPQAQAQLSLLRGYFEN